MKPKDLRVSIEGEVPFHDVDSQRIVWHGHYYKYFEIARTALFRELGLGAVLGTAPYTWVVIETKCRHSYPLAFAEKYRVDAWLRDVDYRVNVAYEVHNLTAGRRAARGHSILATLDATGTLLMNTPSLLLGYLGDEQP